MKVYVVRTPEAYTRIANSAARDAALSFKARGILTYLLSHADGFNLSVAALRAAGTDGKDAIASGLHELEGRGYLVRVRVRATGGRMGAVCYAVSDDPGLLVADEVAEQVGGQVVAADAVARYRAKAGNPQVTPAIVPVLADNPPKADNPPVVAAPKLSGARKADNPQVTPAIVPVLADNPQMTTKSPRAGYPASENPARIEEQEKEKNTYNTKRAGVVVKGHEAKAPNSPAEAIGDEGAAPEPSDEAKALTAARKAFVPKAMMSGDDASLPSPNGRAVLDAAERWDMTMMISAWNAAIGHTKPWSATNTDLAIHALRYWTEAEIKAVLASMGRSRRDISSPMRYFASGLERKAREVRRPTMRPGSSSAAKAQTMAPAERAEAPAEVLSLDGLSPALAERVRAKMAELDKG